MMGTVAEAVPLVGKSAAAAPPPKTEWSEARARHLALASVSLSSIVSRFAGSVLVYLYAAGEVKTSAKSAVQTACSVGAVAFAVLVGYAPGGAAVAAGLGLGLARPLPPDGGPLAAAALAGCLARAWGRRTGGGLPTFP